MLKNHSLKPYFRAVFLALIFFALLNFSFKADAASQADAIAVRVLPNPNHYSISRWYKEQGFKGSPQALMVDGYEAIRDGRTVYVNAANMLISSSPYTIYTNIYLISYNQSSNQQTADILGQVVSHWKFNENFPPGMAVGACKISTLSCVTDKDCPASYRCETVNSPLHKCLPQERQACRTDGDCASGLFCDSIKSYIIRDVKRISLLAELKEALFTYKKARNHYPILDAGTFVKNKTVSTWPSWREVFLPQIGLSSEVIDPVNSLGDCQNFDASTCWNKNTNRFVSQAPNNGQLIFPGLSYIIYYDANSNGAAYKLCAGMESYPNIDTADQQISKFHCDNINNISNAGNTAPKILSYQLSGTVGQPFNGFIKAYDAESNPLKLTLSKEAGGANWAAWSAPLNIQATSDPNQFKIFSTQAGPIGDYKVTFDLSDGQAVTSTTTIPIKISDTQILLEAEDINHVLKQGNNLIYSFIYQGKGGETIGLNRLSNFKDLGFPPLNFNASAVRISANKFRVTATSTKGDLVNLVESPPVNYFVKDFSYNYQVKVANVSKTIKINLLVEPPSLDFECAAEARIGRPYLCYLGRGQQGDHPVTYSGSGLPAGLVLDSSYVDNLMIEGQPNQNGPEPIGLLPAEFKIKDWFKNLSAYFKSWNLPVLASAATTTPENTKYYLYGTPTTATAATVTVKALNDYGTSNSKSFVLKVNNYCGDGIKQYPNSEGKGGYYNDGYEDCDGIQGTVAELINGNGSGNGNGNNGNGNGNEGANDSTLNWAGGSSISRQYACKSNPKYIYPIKSSGYCVFASPLEGGGYCGDGICETVTLGGSLLEISVNCPQDCGPPAGLSANCGNGVKEAGELCDCQNPNGTPCDLGGKSCHDFNIWAVFPYNGLSLKCGNNGAPANSSNDLCDFFENPLSSTSCLYPHQAANNAAFICEAGWFNCDANITNGCESQCCPNCSGRQCGTNGCSDSAPNACGTCTGAAACQSNGQCCTPTCNNKECGSNGCLDSSPNACGVCNGNRVCHEFHCYLPEQACGSDYCGPGQLCCQHPIGGGNDYCYPHNQPSLCTAQ